MVNFGRRGLNRRRSNKSAAGRSSTRESLRRQTSLLGIYVLAFIRLLELTAAVVVIGYYAANVAKSNGNKPVKYNGTSFVSLISQAYQIDISIIGGRWRLTLDSSTQLSSALWLQSRRCSS